MPLQQPDLRSLDDAEGSENIDLSYGESMHLDTIPGLVSFIDTSFNDLTYGLGFQDPRLQPQMPHEAGNRLPFSPEVAGASARSIFEAQNVHIDLIPFNTYHSAGQSNGHGSGLDNFQVEPSERVNTNLEQWPLAGEVLVHQQIEPEFVALGVEGLQYPQYPTFNAYYSSPQASQELLPATGFQASWEMSLESPTDLAHTQQPPSIGSITGSSKSGQKKNQSLPKMAVEILETWFNDHRDFPYPTPQEKAELAEKTRLEIRQIRTWFTNSRRRKLSSASTSRNTVTDHRRGRSMDRDPSTSRESSCSSIQSISLSAQRSGRDRSPRRGRKRSISSSGARSIKRTRNSSCSGTELEDDAFPCTVCWAAVSRNFASWKRHEQEHCFRLRSWTCPSASPTYDKKGGNACVFCNEPTQFGLCGEDHRIRECSSQEENARTFYRKSHLAHHFRNYHKGAKLTDEVAALCMRQAQPSNPAWPCGFCNVVHSDFDARAKHVFQHFQEGKTNEDWSDPEAPVNSHVSKVSNHMGSQSNALKKASEVPQSMLFPSEIPRNASQSTNSTPPDSPRSGTNLLFTGTDRSNRNPFLIDQGTEATAPEQSENGRDASIREHQRTQERPDSPLAEFRTRYICGEIRGPLDPNAWGCHRPFQGIVTLAKHFRSPIGKICIAPLYKFDDREADIELSLGGDFYTEDSNRNRNDLEVERISNADVIRPSAHMSDDESIDATRHQAEESNIRPWEPMLYFLRPLTNSNSSEKLRLPRFLFLKYPALAGVNWRDLPPDDEIDLFALKINSPLSTIISRSTETRSVTTRTLPSHQRAITALSADQSEDPRQLTRSTMLSAPPSFPDSPRAADSPPTADSPLSLDSPSSLSPLIPIPPLLNDDQPSFFPPPLEIQLMMPHSEDEPRMWGDVEMDISDLESTTADCQDDDGDDGDDDSLYRVD